jgi:hypothetical protein
VLSSVLVPSTVTEFICGEQVDHGVQRKAPAALYVPAPHVPDMTPFSQ